METNPPRKLYRVLDGKMLLGVCQGLARYFDLDVTLVRVGFVFFAVITHGGFLLAYFVMAILMPIEGGTAAAHAWREKWRYTPPAPHAEEPVVHHARYRYYGRRPSLIGELLQLVLLALVIWAIYTFIPQTQPFFDAIWRDVQQGLAWLSAKLAK